MATNSWIGGSGDWPAGANWSLGRAPAVGDFVVIGSGQPLLDGAALPGNLVDGLFIQLGGPAGAGLAAYDLTLGAGAMLDFNSDQPGASAGTFHAMGDTVNRGKLLSGGVVTPGPAALVTISAGHDTQIPGVLENRGTIIAAYTAGLTVSSADASVLENDGAITADDNGVIDIQTAVTGTGTITVTNGGKVELDGPTGLGQTVRLGGGFGFAGADVVVLGDLGHFSGFVSVAGAPEAFRIVLTGTHATSYVASGGVLTVLDGTSEVGHFATNLIAGAVTLGDDGLGDTVLSGGHPFVCFAAGTRIRTRRGLVAVEALRVGDEAAIVAGPTIGFRPVVWIGRRQADLTALPDPAPAWPIRIRRDAFARGRPRRDLLVSSEHCILAGGALIPARLLVNGATIAPDRGIDRISYFHVELDRHAVLLAENLPAESYLDTGNRDWFAAADGAPAGPAKHWRQTCAPIAFDGPVLALVRRRLLARAAALGFPAITEPGLHLVVDGAAIRPMPRGRELVFDIPAGARAARLRSRRGVPAELLAASADRRRLGVSVDLVRIERDGGALTLDLDDPAFGPGWHRVEGAGAYRWRWTDGDAALAVRGPCRVAVHLAGTLPYRA